MVGGREVRFQEPGLVPVPYLHDSFEGTKIFTREGGGVLQLSCPSQSPPVQDIAERGAVTKFSASSARRFRVVLAEVLDSAFDSAVLLTMTYPEEMHGVLQDWSVYKAHLRAYKAAFVRRFPQASGFWKLEFQSNGRPHYHCVVFGLGFDRCPRLLKVFIRWHSRTWFRIVGSNLNKHLLAGTRAEYPNHKEGARHYIAKYAVKQEQACEGFTGRYWGKINRDVIPFAPVVVQQVTEREATKVRRVLRKTIEVRVNDSNWKRALRGDPNATRLQVSLNSSTWNNIKKPKRYRMRRNRSITYLGNASAMRAMINRILFQ